jgi:hypothetical protein
MNRSKNVFPSLSYGVNGTGQSMRVKAWPHFFARCLCVWCVHVCVCVCVWYVCCVLVYVYLQQNKQGRTPRVQNVT